MHVLGASAGEGHVLLLFCVGLDSSEQILEKGFWHKSLLWGVQETPAGKGGSGNAAQRGWVIKPTTTVGHSSLIPWGSSRRQGRSYVLLSSGGKRELAQPDLPVIGGGLPWGVGDNCLALGAFVGAE